ncbi:MAG: cyclic nucleotide-binding domain-containing protein [Chloroflexota bacterium]|mgnify:CR=1 FL=1
MIEIPARIAFLKKIHLFYGLDESELETIANQLEEVSYASGQVIFRQGDKSEYFYMIYKGGVRIVRKHERKEIPLAVLVANDYFGEMGLLDRRKRSGTVTATSDTLLLVLSRENFESLYKRSALLRLNLDVAVRSRKLARTLQFKWLRDDEVIYFLARKHPIVLYQKLVLPVLSLGLPLALFYAYLAIAHFLIVAFAAGLSLLAAAGWIAWNIVDWGNDYYIVTNQRVVWLEKVIGIYDSRQESPLSTILSVGVETGQGGRILDFGDVVIRTFVGKIVFSNVSHPEQAQHMIEEYWNRTKAQAVSLEKEAMKNAIRKHLGLPLPTPPKPAASPPASSPPKPRTASALLRLLGANTLKLRYEFGDHVIYRKHWVVLILQAWAPFGGTLAVLLAFLIRLFQIIFDPNISFFPHADRWTPDTWLVVFFLTFFPFAAWLVYEIMDWSNDKYEVTSEQIIDIDRKPFGTESRNAAQLESILGTNYIRKGILGNLFNYGTVYITVGGTKLAFEDVMDPAAVQSDIDRRRVARQVKQNEAKVTAERERMAEWLATYHRNAETFKEEERRNQKPE